ncbi:MAG: hypothetical protein WBI91_05915 [Coriobacteriia bacterium]
MPNYVWLDENNAGHEQWAQTVDDAVSDIYAELGEYPLDIWEDDARDYEADVEDWGYGGTD